MSEEVATATADMRRLTELESQLGQAHADLLLAQADAERMMNAIRYATQSDALDQRLRGWNVLCQMAHVEHPGTALRDEVTAARAANHIMRQALSEIDTHRVGACGDAWGDLAPCEECGDMREIASHALALVKAGAT